MAARVAAITAIAGCSYSTLDDAVGSNIVSTEVVVAPSAPDALATINATVHLVALSRAEHEIAVDYVALEPPTGEHRLDLASSPTTPFWIHPNGNVNIDFVNAGTTNAELTSLCGQTVNILANFTFLDDARGGARADAPVSISCP